MFASKAQKEEKDYQYLSNILITSNIDTEEKVQDQLKKVTTRAYYATIIVLLTLLIISWISPKYVPIWGIIGIMCFVWIWRSAFSARRIMHRYIETVINKPRIEEE